MLYKTSYINKNNIPISINFTKRFPRLRNIVGNYNVIVDQYKKDHNNNYILINKFNIDINFIKLYQNLNCNNIHNQRQYIEKVFAKDSLYNNYKKPITHILINREWKLITSRGYEFDLNKNLLNLKIKYKQYGEKQDIELPFDCNLLKMKVK